MTNININDFPIKAQSNFAGKSYPNGIRVESVWRRKALFNAASSTTDYVAILSYNGNTRVVPYNSVVTAVRNSTRTGSMLYSAFCAGAAVVPRTNPASEIALPTGNGKAGGVSAADAGVASVLNTINADDALAVMTQLVRAARRDPAVAKVVKNLAELV
jgi:hypothetical protein